MSAEPLLQGWLGPSSSDVRLWFVEFYMEGSACSENYAYPSNMKIDKK